MDTHIILELHGSNLSKGLLYLSLLACLLLRYTSKGVLDEGHCTHMLARIGLPSLGTITGIHCQQRWLAWPNTSKTSESGTVRVTCNAAAASIAENQQIWAYKFINSSAAISNTCMPTKGIGQSQSLQLLSLRFPHTYFKLQCTKTLRFTQFYFILLHCVK